MTPGEIRNRLMEHLKVLHGNHRQLYLGDIAAHIIDDPQTHIDALVEAGVLEERVHPSGATHGAYTTYAVVVPHVHEWRVAFIAANPEWIAVKCTCGETRGSVPNRLPIGVPS